MLGLGETPKAYNKAIHGPYDPAVFYGKADIKLSQVKMYQLPLWIMRRNPLNAPRAISRAYWRWNHKYALPKYCGVTPILQMGVACSALFYCLNYGSISHHKNQKYHW